MKKYRSNLEFLMEKLRVSGREVATFLNIDESLVSKWKSNVRSVGIHSPHLPRLIDFFLHPPMDQAIRKQVLLTILFPPGSGREKGISAEMISQQLQCALLNMIDLQEEQNQRQRIPETIGNNGIANTTVLFKGNKGRRHAIIEFFETLTHLDEPQEVMIITQEDLAWIIDEKVFLEKWLNMLKTALLQGHKFTVIYWIDRPINQLGFIFNKYLPLYLLGNIRTFYIPRYTELFFKSSLYLIKNKLGIWGMQGSNHNDRYTQLFYDLPSLYHYQTIFESFLHKSKELMIPFHRNQYDKLKEYVDHQKIRNFNSLVVTGRPCFFTLHESLLPELYDLVYFSDQEMAAIKRGLEYCRRFHNYTRGNSLRMMFSRAETKKILQQKDYLYEDLSVLLGRKIVIPISFLFRHMGYFLEQSEQGAGVELGITDEPLDVNLYLQDENFFLGWDFSISDTILLFYEQNLNRSLYYHYDEIWKRIPSYDKDARFFMEKLSRHPLKD